jgi:UDP-N-acetylmuramate dehydrogenase
VRLGGAEVSQVHGNFLFAHPGARARDVIDLMDEVARRVREAFGVTLEREVVVWERRLSTEAQRRRVEKTGG